MVGADMSADSRFDVWALRETEVAFPPGSRYLYSNVGYRALGFVVEKLVFEPYCGGAPAAVLAPLGLEAIEPVITNEGRPRLAVGYERLFDDRPARRDDPWVPATWLETGTGDGSQAGTVDDLAAFLRALLNRGEGVHLARVLRAHDHARDRGRRRLVVWLRAGVSGNGDPARRLHARVRRDDAGRSRGRARGGGRRQRGRRAGRHRGDRRGAPRPSTATERRLPFQTRSQSRTRPTTRASTWTR